MLNSAGSILLLESCKTSGFAGFTSSHALTIRNFCGVTASVLFAACGSNRPTSATRQAHARIFLIMGSSFRTEGDVVFSQNNRATKTVYPPICRNSAKMHEIAETYA